MFIGDFCNASPSQSSVFSVVSWEFLWDLFLFFWIVCTLMHDCFGRTGLFISVANCVVQCSWNRSPLWSAFMATFLEPFVKCVS